MGVDRVGELILTNGTRDTSVAIVILTLPMIVGEIGDITTTGSLTGRVTGGIAPGTWAAIEPGVDTAVSVRFRSCTAL
jgi:hypothetical protein